MKDLSVRVRSLPAALSVYPPIQRSHRRAAVGTSDLASGPRLLGITLAEHQYRPQWDVLASSSGLTMASRSQIPLITQDFYHTTHTGARRPPFLAPIKTTYENYFRPSPWPFPRKRQTSGISVNKITTPNSPSCWGRRNPSHYRSWHRRWESPVVGRDLSLGRGVRRWQRPVVGTRSSALAETCRWDEERRRGGPDIASCGRTPPGNTPPSCGELPGGVLPQLAMSGPPPPALPPPTGGAGDPGSGRRWSGTTA